MNIIRNFSSLPSAALRGAVTIGNFDGVHLGHAKIVQRVVERAAEVAGPSVVFTFDPHPVRILRPALAPPPLTWTERKAELLAALGVEWMIAFPTDEELLELSARDFFQRIVLEGLQAKSVVEGPNFYFGQNRSGDIETLKSLTAEAGLLLDIVSPYQFENEIVSSSRLRMLIAGGDVQTASKLLTQPYRIRGMVTHGAGRGAKIGFPTANVDAVDTLLPAEGVYAGASQVSGRNFPAAINIGPNPTFGENARKIEVHLVGLHDTIYGQPLEVDFLAHLRDIRPFESVDALKQQLAQDIKQTNAIFSAHTT